MSTAKFDTLQNAAGSLSVPVATVVNGSAKAWVNFNGTGTVAIRASFNVSSITDNGVGNFTVNFTTAMPDNNYSVSLSNTQTANGGSTYAILSATGSAAATLMSTSQLQIAGYTSTDNSVVGVAIFR